MLIVYYQTAGTPVYESELGPNIGYDDIQDGYALVESPEHLDEFADRETYRDVRVVAELTAGQFEQLQVTYNRWQA